MYDYATVTMQRNILNELESLNNNILDLNHILIFGFVLISFCIIVYFCYKFFKSCFGR